jgi:hypothetical protein
LDNFWIIARAQSFLIPIFAFFATGQNQLFYRRYAPDKNLHFRPRAKISHSGEKFCMRHKAE